MVCWRAVTGKPGTSAEDADWSAMAGVAERWHTGGNEEWHVGGNGGWHAGPLGYAW